jgi:hypothetical protein
MADSAAETKPDEQKRRSARITQAVPLTVTGIDALGRPFQERTSTVVINCHGCRYQSKHYVLKNMWVTLEVPHSEAGREPRTVRARVAWIQRPRTVRELFQIGAEMEIPGNLWGIAFPQHDWFPFPDDAGEIPRPAEFVRDELPGVALVPEPPAEDNLRYLPVVDARPEPPSMPEQASAALLAAVQKQVEEMVERSMQFAVESVAKRAVQEALTQSTLQTEEQLREVQRAWKDDLQAGIDQARGALLAQLGAVGQERSAALESELDAIVERARARLVEAFRDGEAGLAQSREALSVFRQQADAVAGAALGQMERTFHARVEETQTSWKARLHADLVAATDLWDQRIESSLESAAQKSAERLARHSQATAERLENELGSRISSLGKVFAEATAEAEAKLGALRTAVLGETARAQGALSQVQSAALGIEEQTERFEALARGAQQELQRRAATVLEAQSRELARRAEDALAAWTARLQPSLESAGQQALERLSTQLDQELSVRLKPAGEAAARLERGAAEAEKVLRRQQESLAKASDKAVEAARGRLQETLDRMAREMEQAAQASSAKWLAELDSRATETTHTTFESLFKTADWYEKKVQTQMQSVLEKGMEQAGAGLREKAGEISGLFASELDHYSRSYVEHVQGQLEEISRESLDGTRKQSADIAAESLASFSQQAQVHTEEALAVVRSQAESALGQISAHAAAQLAQARSDIADEGRRLSAEFRQSLAAGAQEALAAARRELVLLREASLAQLRGESSVLQAQITEALAVSSEQALGEYRKRLEVASSSWLLTTVSRLDQQSQQQIAAISRSAEEGLREACARTLQEVGETLRRQIAAEPAPFTAKGAAAST